jgi:hypothetical protein
VRAILDSARPDLREGHYDVAVARIVDGVIDHTGGRGDALANLMSGGGLAGAPARTSGASSAPPDRQPGWNPWDAILVFFVVVLVVLLLSWLMWERDRSSAPSYSTTYSPMGGSIQSDFDPPVRKWWWWWSSGDDGYEKKSSFWSSGSSSSSGSSWSSSDSSGSSWSSSDSSSSSSSGSNDGGYSGGGGDFGGGGASSGW